MEMDQNHYPGSSSLILSQTADCHSSCGYNRSSSALNSFSREALPGVGINLNKYRKKILKTLLVSRFCEHFDIMWKGIKGKKKSIQEQNQGISAPSSADTNSDMSSKAMVKILRKYKKVHGSKIDRKFRTELSQNVHVDDFKTSCVCELIAFHMNLQEKKPRITTLSGPFGECKLQISEGKSSLLSSRRDFEVDLTCSICLDTFFDPVALKCGHVFCYMCACSAGSVTTVHGMKAANSTSKCPLCRKEGVFQDAERMTQLHMLLKRKLPEYWKERRKKERQDRVKEAKEYWDLQCRAFIGIK